MSFWTDNKIADDFTAEDRYFYLYLFTNPHTNLCGCYEISIKQIAMEMGYSTDAVENLLNRFEKCHKVLLFSRETKEILLLNWHKYNWTTSEKFRKPLRKEIEEIKNDNFKQYLLNVFLGNAYGIDTTCMDITVTVTDTNNININNTNTKDNSNNSTNDIFDLDTAAKQLFDTYPNKNNYASMKTAWLDRFIGVPEHNYKPVANMIWKAVKLFLADYKEKNSDEVKPYRYLKSMDKFFAEDLDYWLAEVNKGET